MHTLTDQIPHVLFYAALIGLAVLLFDHMLNRLKAPARRAMGG